MRKFTKINFGLALMMLASGAKADISAEVDEPMMDQPRLPAREVVSGFNPRLKELWTAALERPDAETPRCACAAITEAATEGMTGLQEFTPRLLELLRTDRRPAVRIAAARTLIALDARQAAGILLEISSGDWQLQLMVNPALAKWDYEPARARWRVSLTDPDTSPMEIVSAARALGAVEDQSAATILLAIVMNRSRDNAVRLCAAHALGQIARNGVESESDELSNSADAAERLDAVEMLGGSSGTTADAILLRLAKDEDAAVATTAVKRLVLIDPRLVAPIDNQLAENADIEVRLTVIEAMRAQKSDRAIVALAKLLDDDCRQVRAAARDALITLAGDPTLRDGVIATAGEVAKSDQWNGIEAAILLLASLGDKSCVQRIEELLASDRSDIRIAAIIAVRRLKLIDFLPVLRARADKLTRILQTASITQPDRATTQDELTQIFETMGALGDSTADAELIQFVPKSDVFGANPRAAAIWAMGMVHENRANDDLVRQLTERATDMDLSHPEAPLVKAMSVVALGRMGARSALPTLTALDESSTTPDIVAAAARWAIGRITGQAPAAPSPVIQWKNPGFLTPIN